MVFFYQFIGCAGLIAMSGGRLFGKGYTRQQISLL